MIPHTTAVEDVHCGLEEVNPEWMTMTLKNAGLMSEGRVVGIERERVGAGNLADAYRFDITYDGDGDGPQSLVGKFAAQDRTSREYGRSSGQYRNEVLFYQDLAPHLKVSIPQLVHAELAPNNTDFILLMEDLAPARLVDQLEGCTADEAAHVVEQIARMHASTWRMPEIASKSWLANGLSGWMKITDGFAQTVETFPSDFIDDADISEASRLVEYADFWKQVLSEPRALWHNDLRVDNVMFDARDGQVPAVVLDWQGVTYGRGTMDLSYFLATSLTTEVRRANERDLVKIYYDVLTAHSISELSLDECWREYRLLAIHPLQTGVFGLGAVRRSERGDRMWKNWIQRSAIMTRDLDSFQVLEEKARE